MPSNIWAAVMFARATVNYAMFYLKFSSNWSSPHPKFKFDKTPKSDFVPDFHKGHLSGLEHLLSESFGAYRKAWADSLIATMLWLPGVFLCRIAPFYMDTEYSAASIWNCSFL